MPKILKYPADVMCYGSGQQGQHTVLLGPDSGSGPRMMVSSGMSATFYCKSKIKDPRIQEQWESV